MMIILTLSLVKINIIFVKEHFRVRQSTAALSFNEVHAVSGVANEVRRWGSASSSNTCVSLLYEWATFFMMMRGSIRGKQMHLLCYWRKLRVLTLSEV